MVSMTRICCMRGNGGELGKISDELGGEPLLVVAFASPKTEPGKVGARLAEQFPNAHTLVSSTSGEFTQDGAGDGTVALFALAGDYKIFSGVGSDLARDPESAVAQALVGQPSEVHGYPHRASIVLLDALAGHGEEAALILANTLGEAPLVGGAAGDDLAMKQTLVGLGGNVKSDSIAVATIFSRVPLGIGVRHGHQPLSSQEHRVTRADGSVVLEVDGRPAWDVWLEHSGKRARELGLDPEGQPGAYLLRFEAGLRIGDEFKVRAPLAPKPGGGILFATPMLEGTLFHIMESDAAKQVDSAVEAARRARSALGGAEVAGALVFDCICRKIILGDGYSSMLGRVSAELGSAPLAGFATYGEIAMNSGDMSGFHNTTTVVLAFPKD